MNPIDLVIRVISQRIARMKQEPDEHQAFYFRQSIRHLAEITAECLEVAIGESKGLRGEDLQEVKRYKAQLHELNKQIEAMNEKAQRGLRRH